MLSNSNIFDLLVLAGFETETEVVTKDTTTVNNTNLKELLEEVEKNNDKGSKCPFIKLVDNSLQAMVLFSQGYLNNLSEEDCVALSRLTDLRM
jgi:hypothetical protein